ncbi:MAG: endonuclease Q family protein [Candidatus Micrarchaeaceae archaeon]
MEQEYISDLHLHSKYARATSERMELANIDFAAARKGISICSTGDFTHALWFANLKENLEESEPGLYTVKGSAIRTRFVVGVEIATISGNASMGIFDRSGTAKRVHHVVLAPGLEIAAQINDALAKRGDLSADGRPMLNMSPAELVEIVTGISRKALVFPAHAWTPWFGVFGSMSGYDSMQEAYEDQEQHVHALETGLSSDPSNNWRVSKLDKYALVSTSDAHSLQKIGREATVFEFEQSRLSFDAIADAIINKKVKYTIEFYPEEGKYHYDGHRKCGISLSPEEAKRYNNICPVCGKPLTLGVLHRIDELADRPQGYTQESFAPFVHAVPLVEILSKVYGKPEGSKAVERAYSLFVSKFGSEFNTLLKADINSISEIDSKVAKAIENIRRNNVFVKPGYDGVFGVVDVLNGQHEHEHEHKREHERSDSQKTISDF